MPVCRVQIYIALIYAATPIAIANNVKGPVKIDEYWQSDITYKIELPWDTSATLSVMNVFDADPSEVLMVAAHHDDLAAARATGLQTAYIERPLEFGVAHPKDVSPRPGNTWHARDLLDLAEQLGC